MAADAPLDGPARESHLRDARTVRVETGEPPTSSEGGEMLSFRTHFQITVILAVLSLAALGMSHLALTDIYHAEGDLVAEWTMVQVAALVMAGFVAATLWLLARFRADYPGLRQGGSRPSRGEGAHG